MWLDLIFKYTHKGTGVLSRLNQKDQNEEGGVDFFYKKVLTQKMGVLTNL